MYGTLNVASWLLKISIKDILKYLYNEANELVKYYIHMYT